MFREADGFLNDTALPDMLRDATARQRQSNYEQHVANGGYPETHPEMGAAYREAGTFDLMAPPACGLTFRELQDANRERGKVWGKGQKIPVLFNAVELAGEVGELMNELKKVARYEMGIAGGKHPEEGMAAVEDELGDVVVCCSLLANKLGIDLGVATARKFNKTSEKHGFPHRLNAAA